MDNAFKDRGAFADEVIGRADEMLGRFACRSRQTTTRSRPPAVIDGSFTWLSASRLHRAPRTGSRRCGRAQGPPLSAPRRSVRIRPTSSCRGKSLYKTQPARIADIAFPALKTSQPRRYASETTLPPAFQERAGFLTPRND